MIGDVGCVWSRLWYNKFADKYNIKQEYVFAGDNKVKFDQFQEIKPESEKWMKNYINEIESELKTGIAANRTEHFTKKNVYYQLYSSQRRLLKKRCSVQAYSTLKLL